MRHYTQNYDPTKDASICTARPGASAAAATGIYDTKFRTGSFDDFKYHRTANGDTILTDRGTCYAW